ncbi:MAG: AAA family ATPase [Candidatus Eisenbacteria bacterium]|nr:AAA family ATPase [Candidatus Eisenbacteria bacterium]
MPGPPLVIVVAGPNGAGKTTFVESCLRAHPSPYLSAEAIAARLAGAATEDPRLAESTIEDGRAAGPAMEDVRLQAGRQFLAEIQRRASRRDHFVVESTLSGLSFRRVLAALREVGYWIAINFIFLRSAESSVLRVEARVRRG